MHTITLFSVPVRNVTLKQAIDSVLQSLSQSVPAQIFFLNAHGVTIAHRDSRYRQALQQATHVFADGIGMRLAAALFRALLVDNVNGTDLFPLLCEALQNTEVRIFLLGAEPGIAEQMRVQTLNRYPGLRFCGTHHGYFSPDEETHVLDMIRCEKTDLLLVGLGIPRQEKWIAEHLQACGVKVAIGVGGLFDFYSCKISRAPLWMRKIGLEWFYRLLQEPSRLWKRYLFGNMYFLGLVLLEYLKRKERIQ